MIVRAYEGYVDHGATVVAINKETGGISLELSTGQPAYCPNRHRLTALDELREDGTISVRVLEERQDRNFRPKYYVEEVTTDAVGTEPPSSDEPAQAEFDDTALGQKFPTGLRVRGTFKGSRGNALRILLPNNQEALLPHSELGTCQATSFRHGVAVKAWVHYVEKGVVMLTKKEPQAEAAA